MIGVDYYDNRRATDEDSWNAVASATTESGNPFGLYTWRDFAERHGKPFALPEWGLRSSEEVDNDNPFFIGKMNAFFHQFAGSGAGQVLYEQYFSPWDSNRLHANTYLPDAANMYRALDWSDGSRVVWPR